MTDNTKEEKSQENVSPDPFASFGNMWENWMKLMGGFPDGLNNLSFDIPGIDSENKSTREAILIMSEYYRLAMMHGIQYWYFIAAKNMQFYPILADKLAKMNQENQSAETRGECLDAIKSWMREITDASNLEARKFQLEFEKLVDDIWIAGMPNEEPQSDPTRTPIKE